jgi:hypothetical protein
MGLVFTLLGVAIVSVLDRPGGPVPSSSGPLVGDLVERAGEGGGAVMTGTGLLNFKKHVDDPSTNALRKAVGPGVVATGLAAFPALAGQKREADAFQAEF